ncbi:MAG: hypothetical protein IJ030_05665 [Oscillospiraceae bacterium]|nr:hypothetical protein [Oscillospiraceae bacterium]
MGGVERYDAITVEAVLGEAVYQACVILPLIAVYLVLSLSLHTIGRRRGIRGSWLAWIPIGNLWLLGSLSDQYQYLVKGKIHIRRKMLLGLSLATAALYVACAYCVLLAMKQERTALGVDTGVILLAFITLFGVLAGVIAILIYMYICCYDLFRSCDPDNGVLFLVLSILCHWILPVLVFAIRKRDGGMPPRRQPPQPPQPPQPEKEIYTEGEPANEQEIPVADA